MIINQFNKKKINLMISNMKKKFEDKLYHSNMKYSQYNSNGTIFGGTVLIAHLQNYINNNIFPAYAMIKYSVSYDEKMFYCNYLCILMYSFIELYAQSINVFYDLKLLPAHKMPVSNPLTIAGVVEQSTEGLPNNPGKTVSIENVIKEINGKYKTNEYYEEIQNIIGSSEISRLKELRNYQMHYQSVFSRYNQNYLFVDGETIFNMDINSKDKPLNEKEYDLFMKLADTVIEKEVDLVYFFMEMIADKKLIRLNDEEKELCFIQCEKCNKHFVLPEITVELFKTIGFSIPHDMCEGELNLEPIKMIKVHPERYNSFLLESLDMITKHECME